MGVLWGVVAVLLAFVVLVSIYDIVRRHLGAGPTAAWILLVLILPFVGSLIYWGMRRPTAKEIERGLEAQSGLRHSPPPPSQRV